MSGETVLVRFVTAHAEYAAAQGDFDISTSLNRHGLSAALNQLFGEGDGAPFDFKINGQFLRQTLGQALRQLHISTESLVTVEFFPAFTPPELIDEEATDAWISCIRLVGSRIVLAMYDGTVRVDGRVLGCGGGRPVKTVAPIGETGLVAGDVDGCVTLLDTESDSSTSFSLHSGAVHAIETCGELPHLFITGGADAGVQLWSTAGEGRLLAGFFGHADAVQELRWVNRGTLLSASLDRTMRLWDVETQQQRSVLSAPCGVLCAAMSGSVIVSGHPDRALRLWDTRVEVRQAVVREFKSHRNWVSRVEWCGGDVFASGSYDGSVKMWNAGTAVPLATLFQHDEKVLALAAGNGVVVAGGSDRMLRRYRHAA